MMWRCGWTQLNCIQLSRFAESGLPVFHIGVGHSHFAPIPSAKLV
jgi:hypothetical protein